MSSFINVASIISSCTQVGFSHNKTPELKEEPNFVEIKTNNG